MIGNWYTMLDSLIESRGSRTVSTASPEQQYRWGVEDGLVLSAEEVFEDELLLG